jgi:hypothetical protein
MNVEDMRRRAAGLPPPCFVAEHRQHPAYLRLEFGNGTLQLIPWVRFLFAVLKADVLTLSFQDHEITVQGRNLTPVADAVAEETLGVLRKMPSEYEPLANGEPFVALLRVERRAR